MCIKREKNIQVNNKYTICEKLLTKKKCTSCKLCDLWIVHFLWAVDLLQSLHHMFDVWFGMSFWAQKVQTNITFTNLFFLLLRFVSASYWDNYTLLLRLNHWCIKSIYNGFAIATDCTLKVVPFNFCFVQVMPLFRISFWLLRRSEKNSSCSGLRHFLGIEAYSRLIYIPHSHQALKLQCNFLCTIWLGTCTAGCHQLGWAVNIVGLDRSGHSQNLPTSYTICDNRFWKKCSHA